MSLRFTLLILAVFALGAVGDPSSIKHRRAKQLSIPKFEYDPNTTKFCSWWIDNDGTWTCDRVETELEVSLIDFHQWAGAISFHARSWHV